MSKILLFLYENGIEGFFISDNSGERFEFELQGFRFRVKVDKSTTIEDFKTKVNNQYLVKLKDKAQSCKYELDSYLKKIDNFKAIL